MLVFCLGDGNEISGVYKLVIQNCKCFSFFCFSCQGMVNQVNFLIDKVVLGGYVFEDCVGIFDLILIGIGIELDFCVQVVKQFIVEGKKVCVVFMFCVELFDEQSDVYKEEVFFNVVCKCMVVEVVEFFGWYCFIGLDGDSVIMNCFGVFVFGGICFKEFGFMVENVVVKVKVLFG